MQLSQLFQDQATYEARLVQASGIHEDSVEGVSGSDLRFLALYVKVSELANLTKCYKFSAQGPVVHKDKLGFRYIEVLRYTLSLGILWDFSNLQVEEMPILAPSQQLAKVFLDVYAGLEALKHSVDQGDYFAGRRQYAEVFSSIRLLGELLDMDSAICTHFFASQSTN